MTHLTQEKHAVLRDVVRQIYQRDGVVTARSLLDEARSPSSPIHNGFGWVWDDHKAAELQRLDHARSLIASIRVEVSHTRRVIASPVYIPNARQGEHGYVTASKIRSDRELALETASREVKRASSFVQRALAICMRLNVRVDQHLDQVLDQLDDVVRALADCA